MEAKRSELYQSKLGLFEGEWVTKVIGGGANQERSPQLQPWQDEDRVALDVDVEARLRTMAVVWSAVSRDSMFADDVGWRGIGGSTCFGLD